MILCVTLNRSGSFYQERLGIILTPNLPRSVPSSTTEKLPEGSHYGPLDG
jgi:hypothetical protein